ncbi:hypothetical protein GRI39_09710 [Altererythrobacter indicus]|uniref:Uncharacterized protein n=1 Tax=Altericroceibacterium indicum TaxID=374177 RepID=A0A845ABD6_9SPHN|nr:hypothetical protein [Altericroceibacterium indicum]MXP26311.1 hypothetical protein [Altericroceibacterium indicum]
MATPYGRDGKQPAGGSNPISAHPAFPALVALWFAALLGLGSLVLPLSLFERVVSLTGLANILPPAAPPLGGTAKFAIAFAAAIAGCLGGWILGRRLSTQPSAHHDELQEMRRRNLEAKKAREPFYASRELGEEGFGGAEASADDFADVPDPALPSEEAFWQEAVPSSIVPDHSDGIDAEIAEFSEIEPEEPAPQVDDAAFEPEFQPQSDVPQDEEEQASSLEKTTELDELGLVQLAERLGQAIEARRHWLHEKQQEVLQKQDAPAPQSAQSEQTISLGNDLLAAEAEEAKMAMAAYFNRPDAEATSGVTAEPASATTQYGQSPAADHGESILDSLSVPATQDDKPRDFEASLDNSMEPMAEGQRLSLVSSSDDLPAKRRPLVRLKTKPRKNPAPNESVAASPAVDADKAGSGDSAALEKQPSPETRPFDPPAHMQPPATTATEPSADEPRAESSGDRAETERVLRAALEKLQRMSGAA